MKGFFVQSKYNYREKVAKAMEDGKGKLIPFDTDEI
jgi:hypothetical protein